MAALSAPSRSTHGPCSRVISQQQHASAAWGGKAPACPRTMHARTQPQHHALASTCSMRGEATYAHSMSKLHVSQRHRGTDSPCGSSSLAAVPRSQFFVDSSSSSNSSENNAARARHRTAATTTAAVNQNASAYRSGPAYRSEVGFSATAPWHTLASPLSPASSVSASAASASALRASSSASAASAAAAPSRRRYPHTACRSTASSLHTPSTTSSTSPQHAAFFGTGSALHVRGVNYQPPGVDQPLLQNIHMSVPAHSLGLIIGRSGSGKTTLLQVLAGLCEQTSGTISFDAPATSGRQPVLGALTSSSSSAGAGSSSSSEGGLPRGARFAANLAATRAAAAGSSSNGDGNGRVALADAAAAAAPAALAALAAGAAGASAQAAAAAQPSDRSIAAVAAAVVAGSGSGSALGVPLAPSSLEERMQRVGLVFQFPERHFLGRDILSELSFTWPLTHGDLLGAAVQRARMAQVLSAVGLSNLDLSLPPWALSGGQQRRLALAIQLVRQPGLLLLDEPLAGLDWHARAEVVELLQRLKSACTLLVVSHDLKEVAPLVDCAWSMKPGGIMEQRGRCDFCTIWAVKALMF